VPPPPASAFGSLSAQPLHADGADASPAHQSQHAARAHRAVPASRDAVAADSLLLLSLAASAAYAAPAGAASSFSPVHSSNTRSAGRPLPASATQAQPQPAQTRQALLTPPVAEGGLLSPSPTGRAGRTSSLAEIAGAASALLSHSPRPASPAQSAGSDSDSGAEVSPQAGDVCGVPNRFGQPCQRVGRCPFHAGKRAKVSPLPAHDRSSMSSPRAGGTPKRLAAGGAGSAVKRHEAAVSPRLPLRGSTAAAAAAGAPLPSPEDDASAVAGLIAIRSASVTPVRHETAAAAARVSVSPVAWGNGGTC
jgi:hypothetical protein